MKTNEWHPMSYAAIDYDWVLVRGEDKKPMLVQWCNNASAFMYHDKYQRKLTTPPTHYMLVEGYVHPHVLSHISRRRVLLGIEQGLSGNKELVKPDTTPWVTAKVGIWTVRGWIHRHRLIVEKEDYQWYDTPDYKGVLEWLPNMVFEIFQLVKEETENK